MPLPSPKSGIDQAKHAQRRAVIWLSFNDFLLLRACSSKSRPRFSVIFDHTSNKTFHECPTELDRAVTQEHFHRLRLKHWPPPRDRVLPVHRSASCQPRFAMQQDLSPGFHRSFDARAAYQLSSRGPRLRSVALVAASFGWIARARSNTDFSSA